MDFLISAGVARHAGGTDGIQGFSRLDAYLRALNPNALLSIFVDQDSGPVE